MAENPYAPKGRVDDAADAIAGEGLLADARTVRAGNGWQWITDAWLFTGPQRWTFLGVFVLYIVITIAFGLVPLIGFIVSALLTPVVTAGFWVGCDAVRRGGTLEVECLFAGFRRQTGRLIALGAISFGVGIAITVVVVGVFIAVFGFDLFAAGEPSIEDLRALALPVALMVLIVIALCLPIYMALWFAGPLIILGGVDVGRALGMSFAGCLRNMLPFLVWSVIVLVGALIGMVPLAIGWLLLGYAGVALAVVPTLLLWLFFSPTLMVSVYVGYRDIFFDA